MRYKAFGATSCSLASLTLFNHVEMRYYVVTCGHSSELCQFPSILFLFWASLCMTQLMATHLKADHGRTLMKCLWVASALHLTRQVVPKLTRTTFTSPRCRFHTRSLCSFSLSSLEPFKCTMHPDQPSNVAVHSKLSSLKFRKMFVCMYAQSSVLPATSGTIQYINCPDLYVQTLLVAVGKSSFYKCSVVSCFSLAHAMFSFAHKYFTK